MKDAIQETIIAGCFLVMAVALAVSLWRVKYEHVECVKAGACEYYQDVDSDGTKSLDIRFIVEGKALQRLDVPR